MSITCRVLCQLSTYVITRILTAPPLVTARKRGYREVSHTTSTRQSLSPELTFLPPYPAASGFSIFAQWDLCCSHSLRVISLPRVYTSTQFLGKKVPTFYSLITKFHSSQLAGPLLAVQMKSDLSRF